MKDRQQSSSSNWILLSLSQPPDPSFLVTGRKSWKSTTLELLLNYWKCFGFLNTYFPAFISSGFPVCRIFGRERLSSWLPLSDDDTQGLGKTNDVEPLDREKKSVFIFLNYTVFLLKLHF